MSIEALKRQAAEKAVEQIKSGMVVGLGTGSTTRYALVKLGELWQAGALANIVGIPTSEQTAALVKAYDLPLATLAEYPTIDLAIDGADEVDPALNLVKGLGGALLREKIVETAAQTFIVIVDEGKLVEKLGSRGPLPVEVTQFAWQAHARWLETLGCQATLRGGETRPFVTDNGNYILDCAFPGGIEHPARLAATLRHRPGIVEHGLFLGMASQVIIAGKGGVEARYRD